MSDFACIYLCHQCNNYWSVGTNKRSMRCDHCGSKDREQTANIDVHVMLARILNEDAAEVANELRAK